MIFSHWWHASHQENKENKEDLLENNHESINVSPIEERKQKIIKNPIIDETIKIEEKEEIQPIIHRQREKIELKLIQQPIYEKNILPTKIEEKILTPEHKPDIIYKNENNINKKPYQSVIFYPTIKEKIQKKPIVEEIIKKTIIEEIQPVIEREIIEKKIIKITQPIYEKIYEPTIIKTLSQKKI